MKDHETKMLKNPFLSQAAMATLFVVNLLILWATAPMNALHIAFLIGIVAVVLVVIFCDRTRTKILIPVILSAVAMGVAGVFQHSLVGVDPCQPLVLIGSSLICLGWLIKGRL